MSRLEVAVLLLSGCLADPSVGNFDAASVKNALDLADLIVAEEQKRGPVLNPSLAIALLRETGRLHAMGEIIAPTDDGHALFQRLRLFMADLSPGTVQTSGKVTPSAE